MISYSREFIVLATCLNYAKAAREPNVSQPSLSRHIADLERELGFQLFERKPMALTPAGRYFVESISDIIARIDTVTDQGRLIANGASKTLSICMVPSQDSAYSYIVYESIARMYDAMPGFSPRFYSSRSHTIFEAVQSGKADVGIVYEKPESLPRGLACDWLLDYPFAIWIHKENPILKSQPVRFEDLAECKLICSTNQLFRAWFDGSVAIFREHGLDPKIHLKDLDDTANFLLDLRPDEVVLTSDTDVTTCHYNPHIICVRFTDPMLMSPTYVLHRVQSSQAVVTKFVEICHKVAEEFRLEEFKGV